MGHWDEMFISILFFFNLIHCPKVAVVVALLIVSSYCLIACLRLMQLQPLAIGETTHQAQQWLNITSFFTISV